MAYSLPELATELRVAGVDVSPGMLKCAKTRLGSRVSLAQCDAQKTLPFNDEEFDACIMMRAANHLSKLDIAIMEIKRVLSSGGIFVATDLADEFDYVCTRIPTPVSTIDVETYKHTREKWERLLKAAKFSDVRITTYNFLNLRNPQAGGLIQKIDTSSITPVFQVVTARKQ